MSAQEASRTKIKTVSGLDLEQVLMTIWKETQPISGHSDPGAVQDCWKEVFETLSNREAREIWVCLDCGALVGVHSPHDEDHHDRLHRIGDN